MNITLYGTGYVGLVTGTCLAELGHDILCVDIDAEKISRLQQGNIPIHEPYLNELVEKNSKANRLRFSTQAKEGVQHGLIQMITVSTPTRSDGSANTDFIMACADEIARYMTEYRLIVNKSTAPIGTAIKIEERVRKSLAEQHKTCSFDIASNPEFLREGSAVFDFLNPDRIIIGARTEIATQLLRELYENFNNKNANLIEMDIESAELTKYAANAMLAAKISFINEMATIAEAVGADIEYVRQGLASDPRIGPHFIAAGCGYGGSCFPKDVKALSHLAETLNIQPLMLKAIDAANQRQKNWLFSKISEFFNGNLAGKTFALWGLAFKPNTNDIREASSRVIMELLWQAGASVQAYDPVAMQEIQEHYPDESKLILCQNKEMCLNNADALIICTEWAEFKEINLDLVKAKLSHSVIFDGRNMFNFNDILAKNICYISVGRPKKK